MGGGSVFFCTGSRGRGLSADVFTGVNGGICLRVLRQYCCLLAIKGVDTKAYLDGFYEMLASPAWDKDAVDYAVGRAVCGGEEILHVWRRQLEDFAVLQGNTIFMPGAEGFRISGKSGKTAGGQAEPFETLLWLKQMPADIMMPFF